MAPSSLAGHLQALVALREAVHARPEVDEIAFVDHCLANIRTSHSQFLQDLWVSWQLGGQRDGFFVEFGAADGLHCSNSRYLERELGWRGILAEPARVFHPALRANRSCSIDTRCVWTFTGDLVSFNQTKMPLHSTIDSFTNSDELAASRQDGDRYLVETVSLMDLLAHWDAPRRIDYLSLDTEGSELAILKAFDFTRYDVRLITVEHNHSPSRAPLFDLLTGQGYRRTFATLSNVDDWYVKVEG